MTTNWPATSAVARATRRSCGRPRRRRARRLPRLDARRWGGAGGGGGGEHAGAPRNRPPYAPESADALAEWYAEHPDATLIAGATDVGLWVTKGLRGSRAVGVSEPMHRFCGGLLQMRKRSASGRLTNLTEGRGNSVADRHPSLAEMIRRYGSVQVRNAATLGGNIANEARPSATARPR